MTSNNLDAVWEAIDNLEVGLFRQPVGPGTIRNKSIKPKAITAGLINVSTLESVQAKTGSLNVTGGITVGPNGNIHSGMSGFDTGVGYWIDGNAGIPRFSLGNSGGAKIRWDGSTLSVTGTITATTGTIGGWTIGSTDLQGSGGVIGLASSGSIRIWSGNATPASAPFQVDSLGNLTATAGAIGGWTIDSTNGLKLGTTTSTRGISTGSVAFYAGSATPSSAPFNVTTAGAVTASNITATGGTIGGITINSTSLSSTGFSLTNAGVMTSTSGTVGGLTIGANSLTIPAGKSLVNADGDTWDATGITLVSAGTFGDSIKWVTGGVERGSIYTSAGGMWVTGKTTTPLNIGDQSVLTLTGATQTGGMIFALSNGVTGTTMGQFDSTNRRLMLNGYLYPGTGTTQQSARSISDNGTRMVITGGDLDINNMTTSVPGNVAWASRGFAADGGGYVVLYVNGTGYKIPTYA